MKTWIRTTLCLCAVGILLFASMATAERPPAREFQPRPSQGPLLNVSEPLMMKQGGDTVWLTVYTTQDACPCNPRHGGECSGGPDETQTFCFEKYNPNTADSLYKYYGSPGTPFFSPASGNGFTTFDVLTSNSETGEDYWHLDQYQAFSGYSWWCGTFTGDRCQDFENAPGYGNYWRQLLVLDPDMGSIGPGDTVRLTCEVRYDTECDYDYAFLQYSNDGGASWTTLAAFNGSSGDFGGATCGDDYFGSSNSAQGSPGGVNVIWQHFPLTPADGEIVVTDPSQFLLGFKFDSDPQWDDKDGRGNTDGAFYVDNVLLTPAASPGETLEFEDMDSQFEPSKWSIQSPPPFVNHWWLAYDPDPPLEPEEGADICELNESWVWSACPYESNRWRIPETSDGFYYRLRTPKVYTGWGEPAVPKEYAGLVVQADVFSCFKENFCDYYDTKVNVYNSAPFGNPANAGWCGWVNIDNLITYGGCDFMNLDSPEDVTQFMGANVDSVWYAWDVLDTGSTNDFCWTTASPKPHKRSQLMIDNVSLGLYDASATFFQARVLDLFQDTFDLITDAHNAMLCNGDMPKPSGTLARQDSLTVDIHDMNGLATENSWVRLCWSTNGGGSWKHNDMNLVVPDPANPDLGGQYIGSISASGAYDSPPPDGRWIPATEVWYYIEVRDDVGNLAYWPATAAPGTAPPTRPYFNNYFEFSILPGTGGCEAPNRILYVDDFGRNDYDYHPCRAESTIWANENFYESVLHDLGYCYDKYDVQGASSGLTNEPWALVTYPDPANPDSVVRRYDAVIWNTSRFDEYTVKDTMQCRLVDFVRKGGCLFILGEHLGVDLTDYGSYSDAGTDTCSFYGSVLGAKMEPPGESDQGLVDPDHYAVGTGVVGTGGSASQLGPTDVFHFYTGCPVSVPHDLLRVNDGAPLESNPQPYLVYDTGYEPGGILVGIYNEYTSPGDEGTVGKVVHICFDLGAMVDSSTVVCPDRTYRGRAELMRDVLTNLFQIVPSLEGVEDEAVPVSRYAYSLSQNRPNPFNPDTDIDFSIRSAGRVSLKVYNVRGQVVKTLVDGSLMAGSHRAHWDGTNENGSLVASGIYFCKMEAGEYRATKKMILLK